MKINCRLQKGIIAVVFCLCSLPWITTAQEKPFYTEIVAFKKQDSARPVKTNSILFVGSSSFALWKDVQQYFPGYDIVNRGFGGSSLTDVIAYAPEIILPYKPRQIIIYCGENDLAANATPLMVAQRMQQLFELIRHTYPKVPVVYVSIKPSISRAALMPKMVEANKLIKNFLSRNSRTTFVDVYSKMLLADGKPNPALFGPDDLHMNANGYAIWQKALMPYLLKSTKQ